MVMVADWIDGGHISGALAGAWPVQVVGPNSHHFQFMSAAARPSEGLLLVFGPESRRRAQTDLARGALLGKGYVMSPLGRLVLPRGARPYLTVEGFRVSRP